MDEVIAELLCRGWERLPDDELLESVLSIPDDIIEAARIDGAGELRIFLRIIVPLCRAPLVVVTIFSVIWRWNDFLWPLVIAQS